MASVINTNIASLNSQRNLSTSQNSLAMSLQRLSSGLRINSAKDDAAGMAISSRMSSQINGLNQAARNANDGISLAQTAEGALGAVSDNLQRIRELAVQSANASNSASDRAALNNEATQLINEIQRVATTTSFNGVNLLDGTFTSQTFQVGANSGQTISVDKIASAKSDALGVGASTSYASTQNGAAVNGKGLSTGDLAINGVNVGATSSDGVSAFGGRTSALAVANAINAANTGVTATVNTTTLTGTAATGFASAIATGTVKINDIDIGAIAAAGTAVERGGQMTAAINAKSSLTGVTASFDNTTGAVALTAADGRNISVSNSAAVTRAISGLGVGSDVTTNTTLDQKLNSGWASATISANATSIAAGDLSINGVSIGAVTAGGTPAAQTTALATAINSVTSKTGVTATINAAGTGYSLTSSNGAQIEVHLAGALVSSGVSPATNASDFGLTAMTVSSRTVTTYSSVNLSSTASTGLTVSDVAGTGAGASGLTVGNTAATLTAASGVSKLDLTTAAGASSALSVIDSALNQINSSRASLGAIQNRFSSVVTNLQTTSENLSASRSRIMDTDFASETANLSRAQILQQAGTAMLAQANSMPQLVLSLLK
ncbi:MAG: flagellin [Sterolibacterium sp.]|nr:flagellin [Sterolibacterium sp.]